MNYWGWICKERVGVDKGTCNWFSNPSLSVSDLL